MKYNLPLLKRVSRSITLSRLLARPLLPSLNRASAPTSHPRCASTSAANLDFGQPIHETHPHLLKAGERKFVTLISPYAEPLAEVFSKSLWASPPLNMPSVDQSSHQNSRGTQLRLSLLQTLNSDPMPSSTSFNKTRIFSTSPVLRRSSELSHIC